MSLWASFLKFRARKGKTLQQLAQEYRRVKAQPEWHLSKSFRVYNKRLALRANKITRTTRSPRKIQMLDPSPSKQGPQLLKAKRSPTHRAGHNKRSHTKVDDMQFMAANVLVAFTKI